MGKGTTDGNLAVGMEKEVAGITDRNVAVGMDKEADDMTDRYINVLREYEAIWFLREAESYFISTIDMREYRDNEREANSRFVRRKNGVVPEECDNEGDIFSEDTLVL